MLARVIMFGPYKAGNAVYIYIGGRGLHRYRCLRINFTILSSDARVPHSRRDV